MKDMFCFQCQQTAHNIACEGKAGVCGKKSDTANYQDELVGALIGLARAAKNGNPTAYTDELILKGLFTTITNVNFNNVTIKQIKTEIEKEKGRINSEKFEDYLGRPRRYSFVEIAYTFRHKRNGSLCVPRISFRQNQK